MARDHHYRPGSFYRIDARTGFATRAERTLKEWTGQIVRDASWEPRQPQDYVRGVTDNQMVPEPRPRLPKTFVPTAITCLTEAFASSDGIGDFAIGISAIGAGNGSEIGVGSTYGWLVGDVVWIMADCGDYWRVEITGISNLDITISPPLALPTAAGNQVVNVSAQGRLFGAIYPSQVKGVDASGNAIVVTSLDEYGRAPEGFINDYDSPYGIQYNDYVDPADNPVTPVLNVLVGADGAPLLDAYGAQLLATTQSGVELVDADGAPLLDAEGAPLLAPSGL